MIPFATFSHVYRSAYARIASRSHSLSNAIRIFSVHPADSQPFIGWRQHTNDNSEVRNSYYIVMYLYILSSF